ncbi:PD-(D/E)XK nuclease family protein [Paenibacillus sp. N4]|uniref:PD-(D/E)XK nuclease family protein n=1 Tax=Paenibacillus vietnamensis TaxID=2590547 RepID=UPI001CD0AE9C|nr:PD-(D/E)XK nuclease family protein [Paenibacillus vietnamensis]MCA0757030.1 PD-(D/E)XK nuclease family protein [Paenibacillus vietnamensis]
MTPNAKIQQLYTFIQNHALQRKLVIAGSHAEAHQWLEQASRRFGPLLNVEVRTLEGWVLERSKLLLAKKGLRYLPNAQSKWIICRLLQELSRSENNYLNGIALTHGLTNVFHQAIIELRECGIKAAELSPELFENAIKGSFIKKLLHRYEHWLAGSGLMDWAGLDEVIEQPAQTTDVIAVDEGVLHSRLHRSLFHKLTNGNYTTLANEAVFTSPDSLFPCETANFFHATGSLAEVREVLRRIAKQKIPLDHVEIIASDYSLNAAAVYTAVTSNGIPCTFAEGLPIGITRTGKAAKLFMDWLESGFQIDHILYGMKQGILRFLNVEIEEDGMSKIIRAIEQAGIGWGKDRYALLGKLAQSGKLSVEQAALMQELHRQFERLLSAIDNALTSPEKLVNELCTFVETYAALQSEEDFEAAAALRSLEQEIRTAGGLTMKPEMALRYIREELKAIKVQSVALPKPGHIQVTSLSSGGQTGRPYSYIIGMSETCWSPSMRQDPVLLDEERVRISGDLPVSSELAGQRIRQRNSRVGMIRGQCTMSFCSYDLSEQKEQTPAYELLQIFRRRTNQPDADYEQLYQWMGRAMRYVGVTSGAAVDALEVWLGAMLREDSRLASAERLLSPCYPWLQEGARAEYARRDLSISSYDGIVDTSRYPLRLPGEAGNGSSFSASMLERYGRCPLQFFYQYTLGVNPKEVAVYDRAAWLNASQRGSLLHDIFERYISQLKVISRTAADNWQHTNDTAHAAAAGAVIHDLTTLRRITEEVIVSFTERVPAPSEHIFQKEAESIRKDAEIFFAYERRRSTLPVFTELPLHNDQSPLLLQLREDWMLPVKGFVDRVDQIAPHRYKIFDYKTGNPRKFKQHECFSGGTQLQLPLYGMAVEQWMRESGFDAEARVTESAYVFPTERGMGEEVSRSQNRRESLADVLQVMTESMKQGLFPPTSDANNCTWCDYQAACGGQAELFEEKWDAPSNAVTLGRILEVKGFA